MNARFRNTMDVLRLAGSGLVIDMVMIAWTISLAIGAYRIAQINPILGRLIIEFAAQIVVLTIAVLARHIIMKLVS